MDNKKIKWACIQPLTGGMYIGALEAIGHDAEWILSYEGLDVANKDKDGNFTVVANEYNLLKWLEKNNHNVPYYKIQHRPMFDSNICEQNIDITLNGEDAIPDYKDIDLIVAVPVCSGLSNSTVTLYSELRVKTTSTNAFSSNSKSMEILPPLVVKSM